MAIPIKDLIKKLGEKDQNKEVEFFVVGVNGALVCVDVKDQAKPMIKVLKMFN